ncbi:FAD-dependent oxidoreductase, partial [Streptomyces sp. NPDC060065]|uniref:FAD-dependent oxidoreductase n=1 Tax=Streptomyces sp. NPDC060065 TaxID=3347050 RepID=UPI0036CAC6FA
MTERPHLAVIGAGPAGLAAALAAAARGIRVTLIDSAGEAGGQFYRQPAAGLGARRPRALHHQWRTWERLARGLAREVEAGTIEHLTDHHVWVVERCGEMPGAGAPAVPGVGRDDVTLRAAEGAEPPAAFGAHAPTGAPVALTAEQVSGATTVGVEGASGAELDAPGASGGPAGVGVGVGLPSERDSASGAHACSAGRRPQPPVEQASGAAADAENAICAGLQYDCVVDLG